MSCMVWSNNTELIVQQFEIPNILVQGEKTVISQWPFNRPFDYPSTLLARSNPLTALHTILSSLVCLDYRTFYLTETHFRCRNKTKPHTYRQIPGFKSQKPSLISVTYGKASHFVYTFPAKTYLMVKFLVVSMACSCETLVQHFSLLNGWRFVNNVG